MCQDSHVRMLAASNVKADDDANVVERVGLHQPLRTPHTNARGAV
jgi:hypothetical protein